MQRFITFASFILAMLFGLPSQGNDASEAKFFDTLGRRAYAAADYTRALEMFLLVQEVAPSPGALYNIAICADLAGDDEAAFAHYREYLQGDDEDQRRRLDARQRAERLEGRLALVEVESDPPEAAVYVDRKELGHYGSTPRIVVVQPGERLLVLEHPGYHPASASVIAERGTRQKLSLKLEPYVGKLTVNTSPASAELQLLRMGGDEQVVSALPAGSSAELPVGKYVVVARAPGHASARVRAMVQRDQHTRLSLDLVRLPKATGRLLVRAGTLGADVFVDGQRRAVTPATLPEVEVGSHLVEVRYGQRWTRRQVTIEKGRATLVDVNLKLKTQRE